MNNILPCTSSQLNLHVVLNNGQSFRWRRDEQSDAWLGVACRRFWRVWRPNEREIAFEVLHSFGEPKTPLSIDRESDAEVLKQYLQLDVDLDHLYHCWASKDKHFAKLLTEQRETLEGIRILKQPPVETLFAFICSANNNIPRISMMVEKLCELYGTSTELGTRRVYDFPTIPQMAAHVPTMEATLRAAGFGYRAASIANSVKLMSDQSWTHLSGGAEAWLHSLWDVSYPEAKTQLMRLPGVGPKVADCICLMALGKHAVVPIDRHVFAVTAQIYRPNFLKANQKTVPKSVYDQIGTFYIDLFGPYAGWAHSVLFSTRLRRFATKSLK